MSAGLVVQDVAAAVGNALHVWMDSPRGAEAEQRSFRVAMGQADFSALRQCTEVSGFQCERTADVGAAFFVSSESVIQRGALVSGLGKIGAGAQEACQSCVGNIESLCGEVAGGEVKHTAR